MFSWRWVLDVVLLLAIGGFGCVWISRHLAPMYATASWAGVAVFVVGAASVLKWVAGKKWEELPNQVVGKSIALTIVLIALAGAAVALCFGTSSVYFERDEGFEGTLKVKWRATGADEYQSEITPAEKVDGRPFLSGFGTSHVEFEVLEPAGLTIEARDVAPGESVRISTKRDLVAAAVRVVRIVADKTLSEELVEPSASAKAAHMLSVTVMPPAPAAVGAATQTLKANDIGPIELYRRSVVLGASKDVAAAVVKRESKADRDNKLDALPQAKPGPDARAAWVTMVEAEPIYLPTEALAVGSRLRIVVKKGTSVAGTGEGTIDQADGVQYILIHWQAHD
jgi:hypothetical protein